MPKPSGWTPPYPAWWPQFDGATVVFAYFGVQNRDAAERRSFGDWLRAAFAAEYGPGYWECGWFDDAAALRNDLYVGYWLNPGDYQAWRRGAGFTAYWDSSDRLRGSSGVWNEALVLPSAYFEALFSSTQMAGASRLAGRIGDPVDEHAYWGGARDRIPALAAGDLPGPHPDGLPAARAVASTGRRMTIAPPQSLCLIHTAQDWSSCPDAERRFYLDQVEPELARGLGDLASNAPETGCAASRYVRELTADGVATSRTFGMCYFLTFRHLEDWAREHPSHLAIFGSFMRLAQRFDFNLGLRLWHQVAVLPPGNPPFEYLNCHSATGLIRHFG